MATPGRVIVVNGPSSAGKSTLGRALQAMAPEPMLLFGLDLFLFGDVLPWQADDRLRDWPNRVIRAWSSRGSRLKG